jgi:hypothetical protein
VTRQSPRARQCQSENRFHDSASKASVIAPMWVAQVFQTWVNEVNKRLPFNVSFQNADLKINSTPE